MILRAFESIVCRTIGCHSPFAKFSTRPHRVCTRLFDNGRFYR